MNKTIFSLIRIAKKQKEVVISTGLLIRDGIPLITSALAVTAFVKLLDNKSAVFQFPSAKQFTVGVLAMGITGMVGREFALMASKKESPHWKVVYRIVGLATGVAAAAFALSQKYFTPMQASVLAGLVTTAMSATDNLYWFLRSYMLTLQRARLASKQLPKSHEELVIGDLLWAKGRMSMHEMDFRRACSNAQQAVAMAKRYGLDLNTIGELDGYDPKDLPSHLEVALLYLNRLGNIPVYSGNCNFEEKTCAELLEIQKNIFRGEYKLSPEQKKHGIL